MIQAHPELLAFFPKGEMPAKRNYGAAIANENLFSESDECNLKILPLFFSDYPDSDLLCLADAEFCVIESYLAHDWELFGIYMCYAFYESTYFEEYNKRGDVAFALEQRLVDMIVSKKLRISIAAVNYFSEFVLKENGEDLRVALSNYAIDHE